MIVHHLIIASNRVSNYSHNTLTGLFTHGVNYELAVEHHERMKQAKKMITKGEESFISTVPHTLS